MDFLFNNSYKLGGGEDEDYQSERGRGQVMHAWLGSWKRTF